MSEKPDLQKSNAPEGGWGWFIVLAYAMNNMVVLPIIQIFTLIYHNLFIELGFSTVQISTIIATNISCGMLLALFNGPILRNFGYRKVAFVGAVLVFVGNVQTSQADSFFQFVLFFGVIVSVGTNFVMSAFNLALNTYFIARRGVATGIAMTLTGFGPILMPIIAKFLIKWYATRGAGLIISSISAHAIAAALLLQPVKWHRKRKKVQDIELKADNEKQMQDANNTAESDDKDETIAIVLESTEKNEQVNDVTVTTKLMHAENNSNERRKPSTKTDNDDNSPPIKSLDDIVKRQDDTIWQRIVKFFDFDLLNDMVYVNISCGLAIAFVAEMSFTLMLPIILQDRQFDLDTTANMLVCLAGADILSRFISPFIGETIKSKVRVVYLFSLLCGIFFRTCLLFAEHVVIVFFVIGMLGLTKGIRSVYTVLVIPSYVPLSKLPAATGLQMVFNGIMLGIIQPLMGILRDETKNYDLWIQTINCLSVITILLWVSEMYLVRKGKKEQKPPIVKRVE